MLTKTKNFNAIYDDMLKQFPKEELKQREHFLELFNNNYVLYEYSEEKNADTKGYCIVFEGEEYILTDYLAIFKKFHSKGYGAKIIEELKHFYPEKLGCFFEVEPIETNNIQTQRIYKLKEEQNFTKNKMQINLTLTICIQIKTAICRLIYIICHIVKIHLQKNKLQIS